MSESNFDPKDISYNLKNKQLGYTEQGWKKRISRFVDSYLETPQGKKMQEYINDKISKSQQEDIPMTREHDLLIAENLDAYTDVNKKDLIGKKSGGYRQIPEYDKDYKSSMQLLESFPDASITKSGSNYQIVINGVKSFDKSLLIALKKAFIAQAQSSSQNNQKSA